MTEGSVTVAALAAELSLSEVTIRNTLRDLEDQGLLLRTHGGARRTSFVSVLQRDRLNVDAKERIAAQAATLVKDDERIMIEAGTTTARLVRHLGQREGVQVVTNSTLVFSNARSNPELNLILTGGVYRRENEALVGPVAERSIENFNAGIAFVGTDGFSVERGLTTQLVEGAQVAKLMRKRCQQTWLLADSSKWGNVGFVSFLELVDVTGIITDSGISAEAKEEIKELNVQLRVV